MARAMLVGALLGFFVAVTVGGAVALVTFLPDHLSADEPRATARAFAIGRALSEGMNSAAAAAVLLIPAGAGLAWRRERRRARRDGA